MTDSLDALPDLSNLPVGDTSEDRTFSQTMFDTVIGSRPDADAFDPGKMLSDLMTNRDSARDNARDTLDAAHRQSLYSSNIASKLAAAEDGYDEAIKRVQSLTNVTLENPLRGGYAREARQQLGPVTFGSDYALREGRAAMQIFQDRLGDLRRDNRDVATQLSFDPETAAIGLAERADADAARAAQKPLAPALRLGANLAGGISGQYRDPVFWGSMLVGPVGATGTTAIARIGSAALTQGAFNAGLVALEQPAVQQWRRQAGQVNGVMPAIEDVGFAFLAGAIPGAAIQGGGELFRAMRPQITKVLDGTASPDEVSQVIKALAPEQAERLQAAIDQARGTAKADDLVTGNRPADVTPAAHDDAVRQAVRSAEDADLPPPETPIVAKAEPRNDILSERAPQPATGTAVTIAGKPASFESFDARELGTDAATFQYKGGGDIAGVTERLKGVGKWDPLASSKVMVFERADGTRVVADGHQRLGLARRLVDQGLEKQVGLDGFLFREADGWTPADVRALAARKNMQEGSGTSLDAARVIRHRPDLLDASLPLTSPMMRQAVGLSKLSDEAWGMALNGLVPENYAAAVGQMAIRKNTHAAIMQDLVKAAPATERDARFLIGDAMNAGFKTSEQIDLFGAGALTRSLLGDRSRVMGAAMKTLQSDKKLFGILADRADVIEAAGNNLARDTNAERAASAAVVGDLIMRLAQRVGPVSDLLNAEARRVADGLVKPGEAGAEFLAGVRKQLEANGLPGLMAEPRLEPAVAVEPGTKEAVEAAGVPAAKADKAQQLDPAKLQSMRFQGEQTHMLSPEAFDQPNPYAGFAEALQDLPQAVNKKFMAHGLLSGDPDANLLDLLTNGIDAARGFNEGRPKGGSHGVDSTRIFGAPYVLLSDPGKTVAKTGVKNVVLAGPAGEAKAALAEAFPKVNFMSPEEAMAFMRSGAVEQLQTKAPDLWDAVALSDRESGADTVVTSLDDALAVADLFERHADQVDFCGS